MRSIKKHIARIKTYVKKVISYILYYTGITKYIFKKKLSSKIVILTYHRILPFSKRHESFSHQAIMVDPVNFDMQLKVINEYFSVINEQILMQECKDDSLDSRARCLVTFDDGWRDNYDYAYPILKKNNCQAIVFVPLDYISSERTFWQEQLGYLLWKVTEINSKQSIKLLEKYGLDSLSQENESKHSEIMNYVRSLKTRTYDEIENIMFDVTSIVNDNKGSPVDKHMTWEQLLELNNNGIKIGSHACSHKILTKLSRDEVCDEIKKSKIGLEKYLKIINSIAYPNGDYNNEIGEITKKYGYLFGFGTTYGYVDKVSNVYNLNRININDSVADSKPLFLATLVGIFK